MTAPLRGWPPGKAILVAGVIVSMFGLLSLYVELENAHARIIRDFFTVDPRTGFVIEERLPMMGRFYLGEPQKWATELALFGLLITAWGARRLGRHHGIRLELVVGPVLAVASLGLLAGLLVNYEYQGALQDGLFALGGDYESPGTCVDWLTFCSRVQGLHLVWGIVVPLLCLVSASAFLLAAPHAWRAGAHRGLVLPKPWACASVGLFVLGMTGLIGTLPHARDQEQVAGTCVHHTIYDWELHNMTSPDVRGMVVDRCGEDWDSHPMAGRGVAFVVADAEGWVSSIFGDGVEAEYFTPDEFAGHLGEQIRTGEAIAQARGEAPEQVRVLRLYVDERTSVTALHEHLRVARAAGITDLLLFGQAFVHNELETRGEWTRRTLCPAGWIRFDDQAELALTDFSTWADLQRAAIEHGDQPLELRLSSEPDDSITCIERTDSP